MLKMACEALQGMISLSETEAKIRFSCHCERCEATEVFRALDGLLPLRFALAGARSRSPARKTPACIIAPVEAS